MSTHDRYDRYRENRDPLRDDRSDSTLKPPDPVTQLKEQRADLRARLKDARSALREREHEAQRSRETARRYANWSRIGWAALNLGALGVVAGVVVVFLDALTPLPLGGGPIVACFVTGGVLTLAAVIYLCSLHTADHAYTTLNGSNGRERHVTRQEFADWRQHRAEEQLELVTELYTELQDVETDLAAAQTEEVR